MKVDITAIKKSSPFFISGESSFFYPPKSLPRDTFFVMYLLRDLTSFLGWLNDRQRVLLFTPQHLLLHPLDISIINYQINRLTQTAKKIKTTWILDKQKANSLDAFQRDNIPKQDESVGGFSVLSKRLSIKSKPINYMPSLKQGWRIFYQPSMNTIVHIKLLNFIRSLIQILQFRTTNYIFSDFGVRISLRTPLTIPLDTCYLPPIQLSGNQDLDICEEVT